MLDKQIRVPCQMVERLDARIDPSLRTSLNFEVFYFSDPEAKGRFDADPVQWCGPLTDPVTLQRFIPTRQSPSALEGGRRFYFVSDTTRAAFAARPDSFSVPRFRMRDDAGPGGKART